MYDIRIVFSLLTLILVSAFTVLIPATVYSQKEWIVDQSAPVYNDLRKAILAAQDGDVISIRPGTYSEDILLEKRIHIFGEAGVKLGLIDIRAGDVTLASFDSEQIRIGPNVNNIKIEQVNVNSLAISSASNIALNEVRVRALVANNVTNIILDDSSGSISGTAISNLLVSDSSITYNLNGGDGISLRNVRGIGSIAGSSIDALEVRGELKVSGSNIEVAYSELSTLDIDSHQPSATVVAHNRLSGVINIRGSNVHFFDNDLRYFKLDMLAADSKVYNNTFTNRLSPNMVVSDASTPDILIQQGSKNIAFMNNSVGTFRGISVGSCETTVKSNYVFLNEIPEAMYTGWNQSQQSGQMAGLKTIGACEEGKGNNITLNRIYGFETGLAVESNNNHISLNEVRSNATNVKVSGSNNSFLRNNFLGNGIALDDGNQNKWYEDIDFSVGEGVEGGGGNYWDRWKEQKDVDDDGIIDTPFVLEGKGDSAIDRLPLLEPVLLIEEQVVVPEFGTIAILVLVAAVSGMIVVNSLKHRRSL